MTEAQSQRSKRHGQDVDLAMSYSSNEWEAEKMFSFHMTSPMWQGEKSDDETYGPEKTKEK